MTNDPSMQPTDALTVTVHAGDGSTRLGEVIQNDTVLVVEPQLLVLPLEVELADGARHDVTGIHPTARPDSSGRTVCALTLPEGTVEFPDHPAVPSIWCRMFPHLPGC